MGGTRTLKRNVIINKIIVFKIKLANNQFGNLQMSMNYNSLIFLHFRHGHKQRNQKEDIRHIPDKVIVMLQGPRYAMMFRSDDVVKEN